MSDSGPMIQALAAVEQDGMGAPKLTARILLLFNRLAQLDPSGARDLARDLLPNGWHGPHIVH